MHKENEKSSFIFSDEWNYCFDSKLFRRNDNWQKSKEFRSVGHVFRRLFDDLSLDAILCIDGRPVVGICDGREKTVSQIIMLRRQLWNFGIVNLLMVEHGNHVDVFSTVTTPGIDETAKSQLSDETLDCMDEIALAIQLRQFIRRVETGAIYRTHEQLFQIKESVDHILLDNLGETRNQLCQSNKSIAEYRRAHALIGRFLFACYLFDRGIISDKYLRSKKLPAVDNMLALLDSETNTNEISYLERLFKALQNDFNGSLFGNLLDARAINDNERKILHRFLSGEDMRSGQPTLPGLKLYDFKFIPVELISSIYENFLGAESIIDNSSGLTISAQRLHGAYYTPPRLAEMTVDIATEQWDSLLNKKYFDPACGSGIFLVILFIRLAEEWRNRNPNATTRERYDALCSILAENLRGTDTNDTACMVSCFSLYLALLDQMEPREIIDLREVLEKNEGKKLLPRLLFNDNNPSSCKSATLRKIDFFDLPPEKSFDLVIGNPPWVSRKKETSQSLSIKNWLYSVKNPYFAEIKPTQKESVFFPAGEFACGFMWKSGLHVKDDGKVCQILPSRVFLSNNTDQFQAQWIKCHKFESMWLLADWRFILFPNADCPCFVGNYRPRKMNEDYSAFEFITPKVEYIDPREALIPILPDDRKTLNEKDIIDAANAENASAAWKKFHWGTPRDARLLDRLMRLPQLETYVKPPPKKAVDFTPQTRQWIKGQGFQPATDCTKTPYDIFWNATDIYISSRANTCNLMLSPADCTPIGDRFSQGLHRKRCPALFNAPLLLINKGCTKFLFSDFDVLFTDDYQAICAPKSSEGELLFLTAYFSSSLFQYLLFHRSANIGIERDIVRLEEILKLPFPFPEQTKNIDKSKKIIQNCAKVLYKLRDDLESPHNLLSHSELIKQAREQLDNFVFEYFDLCAWEKKLICDTVNIFRPSSTPASLTSEKLYTLQKTKKTDRAEYAKTLVEVFHGWTGGKKTFSAECTISEKSELAVVTLFISDSRNQYHESTANDKVEDIIAKFKSCLAIDSAVTTYRILQGFAFYEADKVHILKPLSRRHWTCTAALNDADDILSQMLEDGGW